MAKDKNPGRKTSKWIKEFTRLLLERIFVIDEYIVYVSVYSLCIRIVYFFCYFASISY